MAGGNVEALVVAPSGTWPERLEQPADLRGDDVAVAGPVGERRTEASLGQAQAVMRRSVEVADPRLPGSVDRRARLVVTDCAVQVSELATAQGELGQLERRPPPGSQRNGQRQKRPGRVASLGSGGSSSRRSSIRGGAGRSRRGTRLSLRGRRGRRAIIGS